MNARKNRKFSFRYFVTSNGEKKQLCKTALCNVYQIGRGRLEAVSKRMAKKDTSTLEGKHCNGPIRTSADKIDEVMTYINLFPSESSYHSRKQNHNRQYLAPHLTIPKMYDVYREWCIKEKSSPISQRCYRDIFCTRFNLSFGSPKSDTCSKCDTSDGNEKHK